MMSRKTGSLWLGIVRVSRLENRMKFKVETPSEQRAYITDERGRVRIELTQPADFQHAWRVAEFLSENVRRIAPEELDH